MNNNEYGIEQVGEFKDMTGDQVDAITDILLNTFQCESREAFETTSLVDRCKLENKLASQIRQNLEEKAVMDARDGKQWNVIVGTTFAFSGKLNNAAFVGYKSKGFNIFLFRT